MRKAAADAFMAAASGATSPGEARTSVARAVAGAKALAPYMVMALAEKALNSNVPVDREACRAVIKIGGTPMDGASTPEERARVEKEIEALSAIPAADLERDIFREAARFDSTVRPVPEEK